MKIRRTGTGLLEGLVGTTLLSFAFMVLPGVVDLHSPPRIVFDRRGVQAWRLARNLAERYRLLPVERLERMFADCSGGEAFINADSLLSLQTGGFRRRVFYKPANSHRPPLLLCRVEWISPESGYRSYVTETVVCTGFSLMKTGSRVVDGLLRDAAAFDLVDGQADYDWKNCRTIDEFISVIRAKPVPSGLFAYEFSICRTACDGTITLVKMTGANEKTGFLTVERTETGIRLLGDRLVRPPFARIIETIPGCDGMDERKPTGRQWALVMLTRSRFFVFFCETDRAGNCLAKGQKLYSDILPQPRGEAGGELFWQGVELSLRRIGLGSGESVSSSIVDELGSRFGVWADNI